MKLWKRKYKEHDEESEDHSGDSVPGQKSDIVRKRSFRAVKDMVEALLRGADTPMQKAAIFDYVIWALGQQIAADGHGIFVSGKDTPDNIYYDIDTLEFPKLEEVYMGKQFFDTSKFPTYTGPWDMGRFPDGVPSLLKKGYQHKEADNNGIFYSELGFAVILNGRHHSSWAVYLGSCIEALEVIKLEPFFPVVHTDGAYFLYSNKDGSKTRRKVIDYRFAAMYRLAQWRWELGYPAGIALGLTEDRLKIENEDGDRLQTILSSADLPKSIQAAYDHYARENERLKKELSSCRRDLEIAQKRVERKNQRITELAKQLTSSPQNNP